jgi:hypothetical protein
VCSSDLRKESLLSWDTGKAVDLNLRFVFLLENFLDEMF